MSDSKQAHPTHAEGSHTQGGGRRVGGSEVRTGNKEDTILSRGKRGRCDFTAPAESVLGVSSAVSPVFKTEASLFLYNKSLSVFLDLVRSAF